MITINHLRGAKVNTLFIIPRKNEKKRGISRA